MDNKNKILIVNNLEKYFVKFGSLVKVLDNINFDVYEKDFFGIIGESGSGKSTTGKCIIRLYSSTSGVINFDGKIINQKKMTSVDKKWLCRNMSMIFQDPMSSLNPKKTVLSLIAEPLYINKVIQNEVKQLINDSITINPYFKNQYRWQDYNLNKEYLIPFYDFCIDVFNRGATDIDNFSIDDKDPKTLILDFVSKTLSYESNYKTLINKIYEFTSLTKQLIAYNKNKLESKKNHVEEITYFEAKKNYEKKKQLEYAPDKYWDLQKTKIELEEDLSKVIDNVKNEYKVDNKNFIDAIVSSLKSELKIFKQNKNLTTSLSEYNIFKIKILMIEEALSVFKNFDNDFYIETKQLESFYHFINEKIKEKYHSILFDAMKLEHIGDIIDKLSVKKNSKNDIMKILGIYRDLFFKVKNGLVGIYESNPLSNNNEILMLKSKLINESKFIKKQYDDRIDWYQKLIKNIEGEMNYIKNNYVGSAEYLSNQSVIDGAYNLLEKAAVKKDEFTQRSNEIFNNNILPLIQQQKKDIIQKQKEFKIAQKNYISSIRKIRNNIVSYLKTLKIEDVKYWIEFIKREVSSKITNIHAIDIELFTYLDEVDIYRSIRTSNYQKVKIYKHALKTIITREKVYKALNDVGLKNEHAYRYPHEFSGGQRQRIVIARALMMKPKLIIADEPISALDVSIQAQVVNIMKNLSEELGITFLFIAHDLSMVRYVSNRLIIMHKGRIVEKGETEHIFKHPIHPYTKSLIKASPELSKIHVDLASFSSNMDYDKDYGKSNELPSFHSVDNNHEHYVFGTKEQILKWTK